MASPGNPQRIAPWDLKNVPDGVRPVKQQREALCLHYPVQTEPDFPL
ncbi:MAG: hypothetical protein QMD09_01100 [Desulfatibacillaceae bacterium]|nr:hypothetical protein [Desulfatibacillaceae bacterium]